MSTDAMILLISIFVCGWVLAQLAGYAGRKSREKEERLGKKRPELSEDEKMWERWMDEM